MRKRKSYEPEYGPTKETEYGEKGKLVKGIITALIAIIIIITIFSSISVIPTGYTGVRTTFGQIDNEVVANGINFKIPFVQTIKKVNNKQQDVSTGKDYQIWGETKERTALYYSGLTVTYQISKDKSTWLYANVSDYKNCLINVDLISSAVKSASKTLSDTDATNRSVIEPLVQKFLQESLDGKYGSSTIIINKVIINSADFEDSYNTAVAEKQTAQLAYEKQQIENQKSVEKAEADARVKEVTANADKKQTEISAEAEANATLTKAEAQAKANKLINDSVSDKVIAYMQADKWDGARSKVVVGSGEDIIIDAGTLEE